MAENRLQSIVEAVALRLRGIDGSDKYNFALEPGQVILGYVGFDRANRYPLICVVGAAEDGSRQTDQGETDVPVTVDLLGYVRRDREVLVEALKLAADIKTAILGDETLSGLVWSLSLRQEVTALSSTPFGGVSVEISAVTGDEKT